MKLRFKKLLSVACMAGMLFTCSLNVSAGNNPTMKLETNEVKVSHDDTKVKVKVKIKDWKGSNQVKVKCESLDKDVVTAEIDNQTSDSARVVIHSVGTGNAVVRVWMDGYSRNCQYILVNSVRYQRDKVDDYSVRHYGYMTGTKGEAAHIDDFEVEDVNGEERLYVYFTLTDKGINTDSTVTFTAKFEEDDGDPLGTGKAVANGISQGGSGYKVYFKIPDKTSVIKLVNDDL